MSPVQQLGPYRLMERIGRGGMGEVWKAHDSRLGRDVAVKLSAEQFTDRFEREARAIAALNHPNICTLFDVGPNYLVMELIEGPTLADRIEEGPIPLEEALAIAHQIADALEAAHEKNIVHRDLKPANIKLRADGSVKVLDFGLAKAGGVETAITGDSPTMLHTPTQIGVILGTAAYMAPEQARGKNVDKRADIWSFGVVLHEMLTGKRTFEGEDLTDTLASVVKSDPDLAPVPHKVRRLLTKCLQKDPKKRLRDIGDAWDYLDNDSLPQAAPVAAKRSRLWPAIAGAMTIAAAALAFVHLREVPAQPDAIQFTIDAPAGMRYAAMPVSPDGRYLLFGLFANSEPRQLLLRPVGSIESRVLPGTSGATTPFWSPDSKSFAFFADGKLKRIDIVGGSPTVLCDSNGSTTGTWSTDGVILVGGRDGLYRVAASGGKPSRLTTVNPAEKELFHRAPQFLPGGKSFIYFVDSDDSGVRGVYASTLDRPQTKKRIVVTDRKAIYTAPLNGQPGRLLWMRDQQLVAQIFDAGSLSLSGDPTPIAESIGISGGYGASFYASDTGLLLYRQGGATQLQLAWFDRSGKRLSGVGDPVASSRPRLNLSPDRRTAVLVSGGVVWIHDLERGGRHRFTFDGPASGAFDAIWSPDGGTVFFNAAAGGGLYRKAANGSGAEELLWKDGLKKDPTSISPDSRFLAWDAEGDLKTRSDIWILPNPLGPVGASKPYRFLGTEANEQNPQFSPDGKWIAWVSDESSRDEIYVAPFPGPGGKRLVSSHGGNWPRWSRTGREIFYIDAGGVLMAAPVSAQGGGLDVGTPVALFGGGPGTYRWDASLDGKQILQAVAVEESGSAPLMVVQNWQSNLKK